MISRHQETWKLIIKKLNNFAYKICKTYLFFKTEKFNINFNFISINLILLRFSSNFIYFFFSISISHRESQKKQLKIENNHAQNITDKKKKEDEHKQQSLKQSNDSSDQVDFSNIPLPDIPTKKKHLNKGKSLSKDNLLSTSTAAKIQSKWKQLTEKEYFKKMHYRNSGYEKKPTYLFGENENVSNNSSKQSKDGIFLNRSGWLQTSSQRLSGKEAESRKDNINKLKKANSKIEELISRSEARRANQHMASTKDDNVTILKIDPQSEARQMINDRPAYLPVKKSLARDGPPPTPILSPPPAFQDHQIRNRIYEIKNGTRIQLSVTDER
jgi:hypothetical protein